MIVSLASIALNHHHIAQRIQQHFNSNSADYVLSPSTHCSHDSSDCTSYVAGSGEDGGAGSGTGVGSGTGGRYKSSGVHVTKSTTRQVPAAARGGAGDSFGAVTAPSRDPPRLGKGDVAEKPPTPRSENSGGNNEVDVGGPAAQVRSWGDPFFAAPPICSTFAIIDGSDATRD